jgi:iron complex transport system ATP-binding protein
MSMFRSLAEAGRVVLCALHDLNLAAAYAHQVLLLDGGELDAIGSPQDVITAPRLRRVYGDGIWVGPSPSGAPVAALPRLPRADEARP